MAEFASSKAIDIEDFESPELRPYLREINEQEAVRFGAAPDDIVADSKQWECAMALRALDRAGFAEPGRMIAGIGAGTEATIYALARRGCLVFPVDRYLQRTEWSDVAPAGMLIDPTQYCSLEVPRGHVLPVNSSALLLNLPSASFDGVFSSGSIEHFGSLENVAIAAREIGRILKPGGVAAIATEFRLEGPVDRPWFDDNVILFTQKMLEEHIIEPSGLQLVGEFVADQSDRTFETRHNLVDFLRRVGAIQSIEEKRAVYPNLVLYHDGFLFCSVALALRKDDAAPGLPDQGDPRVAELVQDENAKLAKSLEDYQRGGAMGSLAAPEGHPLFSEVERLRTENAFLHGEVTRANAWKHTPLMRPVRLVYRRLKYGRE